MRKIEQEMVEAIKNRKAWQKDNTTVTVEESGTVKVYLFGNLIAEIIPPTLGLIRIYDGGWQTATTKSRLNAILFGLGYRLSVVQRNYRWYLMDDSGDSVAFSTVRNAELPLAQKDDVKTITALLFKNNEEV